MSGVGAGLAGAREGATSGAERGGMGSAAILNDLNSRTIVACGERLFYADRRSGVGEQMLRVTLMGNLGADPEVRFTQKGTQIVQFRVAVNQVRTGADGERQENTEWFRVRVMGRQAEFAQRLTRGNRVLVVGRLDIGHYQSKEGEARVSYDVWADEVQSLSAMTRSFGGDVEGMESESEVPAEPVGAGAAGVSSLNGGGRAARSASGGRERAANQDLEDLPF
jgi:single-strand DNA-binding protein